MTDSTTTTDYLTDFAAMSRFGATERGGVDRQAATAPDGAQRRWLRNWLDEHGFETGYDGIGNQFGLLTLNPGAPYVLTGSHMDSQPRAGRYDGAYGVLASAHAAVRAADRFRSEGRVPTYNVAVVNWFNEEGSRFTPSMMGSSVHTGKMDRAQALATTDGDGVSVEQALSEIGTIGDFAMPAVAGYAEIHVEQGRILEDTETTIGLVAGTWGARKFAFTVRGEQAHTGSAVMADRHDALLGASLLVVLARELADQFADAPLHTSVSRMIIEPNSPVVIAREATFNMDLRSPDEEVLEQAEQLLRSRIGEIERRAQVRIDWTRTHSWGQLAFQQEGVALARKAAEHLGLSNRELLTVAGHDSVNMKDVVPTVMLFVPSVEGVSHNELERTTDDDAVAGVEVLTETLHRMMDGAL
ncbi:M20 family metallo-hydrolase [Tsukamurella strandjordii]|uniref:M20 family metallo-hydrolase n=1 Tax=Tsukamurella TaxID=2060 RepID=UPI001C7D45EC|nr:M20 family metallo-hydrolase [Tsukamurella sp. TY48]GIZ98700.1 Zn-dependent hydrolase [Tsukamurella sp. TY48]